MLTAGLDYQRETNFTAIQYYTAVQYGAGLMTKLLLKGGAFLAILCLAQESEAGAVSNILENPITATEPSAAITAMQGVKHPGPDEFKIEF